MKNTELKIPALRFPEFSGEWEETRLGEVSESFSGGTPSVGNKTFYGGEIPFIKSGEIRLSKTADYITEEGLNNSSARLVNKGDILYALYGATSGEVGISKIDGAINQAVLCIRSSLNHYFLFSQLNHYKTQITHTFLQGGQGNLSGQIVKELKVYFPSLPEQQKIADFLSAVDKRLQLLKDKKTKLEEYKRGVMQRIFSQELRFTRPDGSAYPDWELKRLKQFVDQFIVPMRDKPKFLDGNIPWCRIEDFEGKYLYKSKSNQGVSKNVVRDMNLKIYPINTLLVSCSANLGICAIVKKELITNQTFIGLVPNHNLIHVEFLYYIMGLSCKRLNALSSGTTISYLSREEFEKFTIEYPHLDEQRQIADFLSAIDDKITLLTKQIESTEQYKKGLLQQMFV